MGPEIIELAVVLGLAAVFGMVAKALRQPLVLAYLAVGLILGMFQLTPTTHGTYELFSNLGVMFLLFLVGLEIKLSSLRYVGSSAGIIALGQVSITAAIGFAVALLLGQSIPVALYLGFGLALSSTIVIVKLISEKHDLNSLYGKLSIGVLVFQDVAAMLALLVLAGWQSGGGFSGSVIALTLTKGVALVVTMVLLSRWVMPSLFRFIARSPELVLVASLAWLFAIVTVVKSLGLSIEIGGFLAGLALANASEHFHIANRIRPLRDFFLLLFFVTLGTTAATAGVEGSGGLIVILSLFVLVGKPLIVFIFMTSLGYHRRTAFLTGLTMGQVSEFSLVLVAAGVAAGHLEPSFATLVTIILVVTITLSSFGVVHAEHLYRIFDPVLRFFERRQRRREDMPVETIRRPIVLIGAHRTGEQVLEHLPKGQVAVVDFDPEVVHHLRRRGYAAVYGDLTDPDVFESFDRKKITLVISTSPSFEDNVALVAKLGQDRGIDVIARAENESEAKHLYALGAEYVLVPQLTAGQHLGNLVAALRSGKKVTKHREHDLRHLAHDRL